VFCRDRATHVDFKDVPLLRRFISDRGKIRARRVTGTCVQHQRDVAAAVKNAREMALLPYASSR
jgi:small subunit ribosomal protein S18